MSTDQPTSNCQACGRLTNSTFAAWTVCESCSNIPTVELLKILACQDCARGLGDVLQVLEELVEAVREATPKAVELSELDDMVDEAEEAGECRVCSRLSNEELCETCERLYGSGEGKAAASSPSATSEMTAAQAEGAAEATVVDVSPPESGRRYRCDHCGATCQLDKVWCATLVWRRRDKLRCVCYQCKHLSTFRVIEGAAEEGAAEASEAAEEEAAVRTGNHRAAWIRRAASEFEERERIAWRMVVYAALCKLQRAYWAGYVNEVRYSHCYRVLHEVICAPCGLTRSELNARLSDVISTLDHGEGWPQTERDAVIHILRPLVVGRTS